MKKVQYFILSLTILVSCKPGQKQETTETPKELNISPFDVSTAYPDAAITSMQYDMGTFNFKIKGDYKLGAQTPDAPQKMCANSDKGQHIHLIVDNKPYEAKYDSSFHYKIDDGDHYILGFLSRSYHESIKAPGAYALVKATIIDSSFKSITPVTEPMLFYSRPKGNYVGNDTKKIMLDFYLANCELGNKYKVKANVNGQELIIDKWQPYYLEGLPMGENKIELSLIDSTGNLVACPLNPVERKFTLTAEPSKQ